MMSVGHHPPDRPDTIQQFPTVKLPCAVMLRHEAETLAQSGRHEEADEILASALALAPDDREVLMALYRSARHQRAPEVALAYLNVVLARFPNELGLLLDRAETLLDAGRLDAAELCSRRALELAPAERRAHLALIHAARIRDDDALLAERIDIAFSAVVSDAGLFTERGTRLLAKGLMEAAERDFRSALQLEPRNARAALGMFHAGRGRVPPTEELARVEAAIEVAGPELPLLADRADALVRVGRIDDAEREYRAVIARAPADPRALLGLFHAGRGRVSPREELDRIAAVIAVCGPEPALRLDRAEALIRAGKAEAAEAEALAVLAEASADPRALLMMVKGARVRRDPLLLLERVSAALAFVPDHEELGWDRATALVELGRIDEAKAQLETLERDGADDPATLMQLGRLARATGDRRAALTRFERVLERTPNHCDAMLEACTELTALDRGDDAAAMADRLAAHEDYVVPAWMCRGFIARQHGDRSGALAWFRRAMAAAPDDSGAALNAAAEMAECGDVDGAEALAHSVLARAGTDEPATRAQVLLRLAHIAQLRSDRSVALRYLEAAADLAPRDPDLLNELASECREQGLFDEATAVLDRLSAVRPTALVTMLAHGHLARRRGDRAGALVAYEAAHLVHPDAAAPLSEMAFEQRALNRPREADESLRAALARDPGHIDATMRLAEQHFMAEKPDECIALCAAVRARMPHFVPAWLIESRAIGDRDGASAALAFISQVLETIGFNPELVARKVDLLRDTGDHPMIERLAADAIVRATRHPGLWASVVRAILRFADFDDIEAWLNRAPIGGIGPTAEAQEFRGMLAEARWRFPEALAHYRRVPQIDPNRNTVEQDIARVCLVELDVDAAQAALNRYVQLCAGDRSLRGESIKASQTHVGQLLDEYRLDRQTVDTLAGLKALPPADRIEPIRAIVTGHPHSTAVAAFLLVSLREAGSFDDAARDQTVATSPIPRRIGQFWYQAEVPDDVDILTRSWKNNHPDFVYTRFDDTMAQDWLQTNRLPVALTAYRRAAQKAQKADLFRLAVLAIEGGLYADADDRCLAPFDPWLAGSSSFVAYQEDYGTLGNNVLACAPRHPVIVRALQLAVRATNRGDNDLLWLSTGPGLLSRAFAQITSETPCKLSLPHTRILDRRTLGRSVAMHCQVSYKTTENHWLHNLMK